MYIYIYVCVCVCVCVIAQSNTIFYWVITLLEIIKSFITATCFGYSYRAIFSVSPKKRYTQLAMIHRAKDLV